MARNHFLLLPHPQSFSASHVIFAAMTLAACAFTLFKCASHSRKFRHWTACYKHDQEPVIQHNFETNMLATGDLFDTNELMFSCDQGGPVWQKNILMGGKCQLPDFSGVIIYDSEGNVVTPAKNSRPLLTWK